MKKVISLLVVAVMLTSLMASAAAHTLGSDCCPCCLDNPEVPCLEEEHCACGGRFIVITPFFIGETPPRKPI